MTEREIADAFSDWAWELEGVPLGRLLPQDAARIAFKAGAQWACNKERAAGEAPRSDDGGKE